uniref:Uncharacterized protein n=1 Tax=Arundo donax TaxID=35708 RepID=A0A0A9CYU0_ARUDO
MAPSTTASAASDATAASGRQPLPSPAATRKGP